MPIINPTNTFGADWVGKLTFSGTYATATYFTQAGCSLCVDPNRQMAFLTIQGGTSTDYENIYFQAANITLPEGVTFLTTQTYGGPTGGTAKRYFTAAFSGVTGVINVDVKFSTAGNTSYDYITPTITMSYA